MHPWRIEFFEVLAQIGPVLLLAYVVEERVHRPSTRQGVGKVIGLAFAILAEVMALAVVAGEARPTRFAGLGTGALMMLSAAYLALSVAGEPAPMKTDAGATWGELLRQPWSVSAVLAAVLVVAALVLSGFALASVGSG